MTPSSTKRPLNITVMTPFIQTEGVEGALDNIIDRAGATAVTVNTSVVAPGDAEHGSWQPPSDAGASVRLFDRPIWGQQALWIRSGPGHRAQTAFFDQSPYKPRQPNDLTEKTGPIVGEFITAAKARGLKVYVQTGAADPPGLREEDAPTLPNGRKPARMANTGSLASPAIRQYNRAFVQDIFTEYPMLDGLRLDWPEAPCYKLDEAFQDFCPHVRVWAEAHGFDFERIRHCAGAFYEYLHGHLTNTDLQDFASRDRGKFTLLRLQSRYPSIADWFRLKAALSTDLIRDWRDAVTTFGGPDKDVLANAFMPPFTYLTGLDFATGAPYSRSISPKLYTMHWSLIIKFWGDVLLAKNHNLDEGLLVKALVHLLDLTDTDEERHIADYGYPEPDEPHPIPDEPQIRKIHQALAAAGGQTKITPLVHGYGPLDDFCRRLQLVADSPADGVCINRYGYLSDEKLAAIGRIWY